MFGLLLKTKLVVLLSGIVTVMLSTTLMTTTMSTSLDKHDNFQRPSTATLNTPMSTSQVIPRKNASTAKQIPNNLDSFRPPYKEPGHPQEESKHSASFGAANYNNNHKNNSKQKEGTPQKNSNFVDLAYIHVNDGKHPHMGATSPQDGNTTALEVGLYVLDVTHLRNHPPPMSWTAEQLQRECQVRDKTYEALQRIRIADNPSQPPPRPQKLFCAIYSMQKNRNNYQAIRETWGPKCDGFMIGTDPNHTLPAEDAVHIAHAGLEEYQNMYQKVRSIWSYIYDHYYEDYDWFHIGGDDMMVLVENLRAYVESEEIQRAAYGGSTTPSNQKQVPLFLGGSIAYAGDMKRVYQTGGPGYTLNKAALKKLVVEGLPRCGDEKRVSWEDIVISRLFREMNITAYRTTDQDNGVRYNHYGPATHYFGEEPDFYPNWTAPLHYNRGQNYSSVHSISFHYIPPRNMRRFYALLYGLCPAMNNNK